MKCKVCGKDIRLIETLYMGDSSYFPSHYECYKKVNPSMSDIVKRVEKLEKQVKA